MIDVCRFRRFDHVGKPVDVEFWPLSPQACRNLSNVWVGALQRGDYSRIEFELTDGSKVVVRKLKPR